MKYTSILLVITAFTLAGCGGAANNTGVVNTTANNANMRGTNTNTGYVTNSDATTKPTMPANATNLTPGNVTNGNSNSRSNVNANANANANRR